MRILGCDPSPTGIAWAVYDDGARYSNGDIVEWGELLNWYGNDRIDTTKLLLRMSNGFYRAAIELPVIFPGAGNEVRDTLLTTGIWIERLEILKHLQLPRATVASALHAKGDARINAKMCLLCPALNSKAVGLNSHTRAAAAVAYVAVGRINSSGE